MTKISKRNYLLMFMDSVLFTNAMAFLSINSVIPYFLNNLKASTFEISLAGALVSICSFITQPLFSKLAMRLPYKIKGLVKILLIQRLIFLAFIICIPFIASKRPGTMVIMFLIFWGVFNLFVGSYSPFYIHILSKLVDAKDRGRLLGFAGAFGNLIAVLSSILIGFLLNSIAYPYNYAIIFLLGTIILLIDVLDFHLMKNEVPDKPQSSELGYFDYIKALPRVIKKDRRYSKIVLGFSLFVITNVSLAFYTLYAIRTYKIGGAGIAIFTGISMIINIAANMIFGMVTDRLGLKYVLKYAALCGIAGGIIIIFFTGLYSVYIAFMLSTFCACGYNLSTNMMIIEEAPKEELSIYITVTVLITLIVSSLVMLISGFIIDRFSFTPIFIVTLSAALGAYLIFRTYKSKS